MRISPNAECTRPVTAESIAATKYGVCMRIFLRLGVAPNVQVKGLALASPSERSERLECCNGLSPRHSSIPRVVVTDHWERRYEANFG